jgi:hypothetical protein
MALAPRAAFGLSIAVFAALAATCDSAWAQSSTPRADVEVLGGSSKGSMGRPRLVYDGSPIVGNPFALRVRDARANSFAVIGLSAWGSALPLPDFDAVSHLELPPLFLGGAPIDAHGVSAPILAIPSLPEALSGVQVFAQAVVIDPFAMGGWAFTSGLRVTVGVGPASPWRQFRAPLGHFDSSENVAVAVGDIDGNGYVDIVAAGGFAGLGVPVGSLGDVEIMLNDGDRSFTLGAPFTFVNVPYDVELADFDSDGHLDLAVVNFHGSNVSIGRGAGDGTFSEHFIAPLDLLPTEMLVRDFDGDGNLDIVANNRGATTLSLLRGNGDATFAPRQTLLSGFETLGLAAADIDANGLLDILATNTDESLSVLLQQSLGSFVPANFDTQLYGPTEIAVVDFDADGDLDVVVGSQLDEELGVMLGDGSGGFVLGPLVTSSQRTERIALHDMDGDGRRDLVLGWRSPGSVFVTPAEADGSFLGLVNSRSFVLPLESGLTDHVVADLDGDGFEDLAGVGEFARIGLVTAWRDASGAFESPQLFSEAIADRSFTIGDFNVDGMPDLAYQDFESTSGAIALGDGLGGFLVGAAHTALKDLPARTGDVDGDGIPDVVMVSNAGLQRKLYVSLGLGTALGDLAPALTQTLNWNVAGVELGDVDGDGLLDAVVAQSGFVVAQGGFVFHVFIGNGDGTFVPSQAAIVVPLSPAQYRLGDLDGDGDMDIAGARGDELFVVLGTGDGTFGAPQTIVVPNGADDLELVDLDGDAVPEIVLKSASIGGFTVVKGSATATPEVTLVPVAISYISSLAAGDVDGDGRNDLVLGQWTGCGVIVFRGRGDRTFEAGTKYCALGLVQRVELVDADGDGDLDILATSFMNGEVSLLRNLLVD